MTTPTIDDDLAALSAAIEAGPTPGPWRWEINLNHRSITLRGGRPQFDLTIMDFDRWGMRGATITLRDPAVDGMNIMHRLPDRPDWIAPFPSRAHHAHWCASVKHPDTAWIEAASPDRIARLIAALREAREDAERLRNAGALLSNIAFNLKQHPGRAITADECETLARVQKQWDDAARNATKDAA